MNEKKYFIPNQYGEITQVTKEEYDRFNGDFTNIPHFQAPKEQTEGREKIIDNVIKVLNTEEITDGEMARIASGVKTQRGDEEKSNRERLDDDIKDFKTAPQQESIDGKEAKIQRITEMLNRLGLSTEELTRITGEVERARQNENTSIIDKEGKNNGRE